MENADSIRDKKKIDDVKANLKCSNLRDYALFVVGINVPYFCQ